MTAVTTVPAPAPQPMTRSDYADHELREAILRGDYAPGDVLVIAALAKSLNLSATPLREALRRLAAEGLVELTTFGSARVATVDLAEAIEIYELRLALEPMALERSVRRGDRAYRAAVEAAWAALGPQRFATPSAHAAFHRTLLSSCDSAWLLRLSTMLSDRAGLMLKVSANGRPREYTTALAHERLKDLAVAGDAPGAAEELHRHLDGSLQRIRTRLTADAAEPPPPR